MKKISEIDKLWDYYGHLGDLYELYDDDVGNVLTELIQQRQKSVLDLINKKSEINNQLALDFK